MRGMEQEQDEPINAGGMHEYEPPRVETVLTSEQLEREVLYAGNQMSMIVSDRSQKEHFAPIDAASILGSLCSLRVERWNYKGEPSSVRHIGPMAQDFSRAFGVGSDDRHIHNVDAFGVTTSAIQALHRALQQQAAEAVVLRARLEELEARLRAVESDAGSDGESPRQAPWPIRSRVQ